MNRTILLFALLLLFIPSVAVTDDTTLPENKDWRTFIGEAQDNYSMKTRGDEAMRTLDSRVDEVLAGYKTDLDDTAYALLEQNQSAWEKQIRTKCSFLADTYRGGSHASLAYRDCVVAEQIARVRELQAMYIYRTSP